jgi:hypothetical protein
MARDAGINMTPCRLLEEVSNSITQWPIHAEATGVPPHRIDAIEAVLKRAE